MILMKPLSQTRSPRFILSWCFYISFYILILSSLPSFAQPQQTKDLSTARTTLNDACNAEGIRPLHFSKKKGFSWILDSPPEQYLGKRLDDVILHCSHQQCESDLTKSEIIRAIQIPIYQGLSKESLEASWSRLMALDLFEAESFLF